jgi:hypothetical protein
MPSIVAWSAVAADASQVYQKVVGYRKGSPGKASVSCAWSGELVTIMDVVARILIANTPRLAALLQAHCKH